MLLELGNAYPAQVPPNDRRGHHVTSITVPDTFADEYGNVHYDVPDSIDWAAFDAEISRTHKPQLPPDRQGITRMEDATGSKNEALLCLLHPTAAVARHFGTGPNGQLSTPTWVWAEKETPLVHHLSDRWQVPHFVGDDRLPGLEDTHTTKWGPPGVVPGAVIDLNMEVVNGGRVLQSQQWTGGQVGYSGTNTSTTSTTLHDTGATWTTNQWAGYRVYAYPSWMNVESNSATVLTGDRWYAPATPGGAAGTTPTSTSATYIIADGGGVSAWFMGLTANNSAVVDTDTSLTGEITTSSGGLVRTIGAYALTSGTHPAAWTLTVVFTATSSDSLPVTIAKCAEFISMVPAWTAAPAMAVETLLSTTATVSASGDQLTVTDTYAGA